MEDNSRELIPTRASLLGRLKNSKDQSSWQEFFDTYSPLIFAVAQKAGLSDAQAKAVLKATVASVAEHMPSFRYDPRIGSFKVWLRNLTRLQIVSLTLKKRTSATDRGREVLQNVSHATEQNMELWWEVEWKANLHTAAVSNVKRRLNPKEFQIYDLQVNKGWTPERVAALLEISTEETLRAKANITEMIQAEARRLEEKMI